MTKTTIRRIKLQGKYRPRQSAVTGLQEIPWLNISGRWLEQAGFKTGGRVTITVTENTLVIKNCPPHGTEND